ncbi:hypothetical protein D3C77_365500 [compost metagenome]
MDRRGRRVLVRAPHARGARLCAGRPLLGPDPSPVRSRRPDRAPGRRVGQAADAPGSAAQRAQARRQDRNAGVRLRQPQLALRPGNQRGRGGGPGGQGRGLARRPLARRGAGRRPGHRLDGRRRRATADPGRSRLALRHAPDQSEGHGGPGHVAAHDGPRDPVVAGFPLHRHLPHQPRPGAAPVAGSVVAQGRRPAARPELPLPPDRRCPGSDRRGRLLRGRERAAHPHGRPGPAGPLLRRSLV